MAFSHRFGKLLLVLSLGLLSAVVLIAATGPRADIVTVKSADESGATLSAEDLAMLANGGSRPAEDATGTAKETQQIDRRDEGSPNGVQAEASIDPAIDRTGASQPATGASPSAQSGASDASALSIHEKHRRESGPPKSTAPPPRKAVDPKAQLSADDLGRVHLDWDVLATTQMDDDYKPTFIPALAAVDGKEVSLAGFMSPLDEIGAMTSFLLVEYPLGCFYCQTPLPTGLVFVDLAPGKQEPLRYGPVKIKGLLKLNRDNPEDFLYLLSKAEVVPID